MEPISWAVVAELIIKYGIPLADKIVTKAIQGTPVTQPEWDEVRVVASQNARSLMLKKLVENGIDPASEQGKLFLSLT